jgi:hypothetical protein
LQERDAEGGLQFSDLLAERGLGYVNGPGGLRKAACFDNSNKIIEMAVMHPPDLNERRDETAFALKNKEVVKTL